MNDKLNLTIAIAAATIVMGLLTIFVIYFVIIYRKKQRAFEWQKEVFKQALLQTEIEIKEQTLSDISRDLHDNLGQVASLIKINLNLALPNIPAGSSGKITESLELLKQLIQDIRSLSVSLKGENLTRFGLVKMIEKDIIRYQSIGELKIDFHVIGNLPSFDKSTEIFLYRMTQEIFNNILKHAKANKVEVKMSYTNSIFQLSINDNGIGFDISQQPQGAGIINLKQRCEMIGAEFNIQSKLNQGTTINIDKKMEL